MKFLRVNFFAAALVAGLLGLMACAGNSKPKSRHEIDDDGERAQYWLEEKTKNVTPEPAKPSTPK